MKSSRFKASYGELDDSSCKSLSSSFLVDSPTRNSDGGIIPMQGKSIAIGPDGQIITQSINPALLNGKEESAEAAPSTRRPMKEKTIVESTIIRRRRKKETVMIWYRNSKPTEKKHVDPPPPIEEEQQPRQSTPHVRPKRSQNLEKRRKQRKEIILGWERNPPTGGANIDILRPVSSAPINTAKSSTSLPAEKQTDSEKRGEKERISGQRHRDSGSTNHRSRKQPDEDNGKESSVHHASSNQLESATPTTSSKKPAHIRVYGARRTDRSRSGSRHSKRRNRKAREETILQWTRENGRKELAMEGKIYESDRVDKSTLGEVTKILEQQKRYDEDKREAIGKLRGRRYRSGGPATKGGGLSRRNVSSRSTGPGNRDEVATTVVSNDEGQFSWRREPPGRNNSSSSRIRRKPSRSAGVAIFRGTSADESSCCGQVGHTPRITSYL